MRSYGNKQLNLPTQRVLSLGLESLCVNLMRSFVAVIGISEFDLFWKWNVNCGQISRWSNKEKDRCIIAYGWIVRTYTYLPTCVLKKDPKPSYYRQWLRIQFSVRCGGFWNPPSFHHFGLKPKKTQEGPRIFQESCSIGEAWNPLEIGGSPTTPDLQTFFRIFSTHSQALFNLHIITNA